MRGRPRDRASRRARAAGGSTVAAAPIVVAAAATIHTPLLLAASGLGGGSGELGRNLSLHPATAVWGVFDEPVDMGRGVPQSYYVDEFAADGHRARGDRRAARLPRDGGAVRRRPRTAS